jgi:hypothetical protein
MPNLLSPRLQVRLYCRLHQYGLSLVLHKIVDFAILHFGGVIYLAFPRGVVTLQPNHLLGDFLCINYASPTHLLVCHVHANGVPFGYDWRAKGHNPQS